MIYRHHRKNGIIMLYGYIPNNREIYCMVMTLAVKQEKTQVYGWCLDRERKKMNIRDLKELWEYVKKIVPTKYLQIEVLPHHARAYEKGLKIYRKEKTKTFNGIPCYRLTIDLENRT